MLKWKRKWTQKSLLTISVTSEGDVYFATALVHNVHEQNMSSLQSVLWNLNAKNKRNTET